MKFHITDELIKNKVEFTNINAFKLFRYMHMIKAYK